jgi:uncharacterized protein (TIGR03492 family)
MRLLCLSNGHGEDVIAVRILEQLQQQSPDLEIVALPLVGEGYTYAQANIPIIGTVQKMPSGGFIYMDSRQFWRDVKGGLLKLTLAQYKLVKKWGKNGGFVLAVGDIVPLLFAWLSGANYGFVGTAKSEYYLRDEYGWLHQTSRLEKKMGSVYFPWERWLMSRKKCQAVFPRDGLTTAILKEFSIPAFDLGNPMMDGIIIEENEDNLSPEDVAIREQNRSLTIVLLPGSRIPEVYDNWDLILIGVQNVIFSLNQASITVFAAIAPGIEFEALQGTLSAKGWSQKTLDDSLVNDPEALEFRQGKSRLILSHHSYQQCLQRADLAIAMAGTATEQFVGLGKPAIIIPGKGPQFTPAFAEAQTRLLGCSVMMVQKPDQVGAMVEFLLKNPDQLQFIAENGKRRMGKPGAAARIAQHLLEII